VKGNGGGVGETVETWAGMVGQEQKWMCRNDLEGVGESCCGGHW
jgi:hypothetical protein